MMNTWTDDDSAINHYYDGDFPSQSHCKYPENFDEITEYQGLRFDVPRYVEIARAVGGPILEPCCGTGRVALPLAAAGFDVVAVDLSAELIRQFTAKLAVEPEEVGRRIQIVKQDITRLSLPRRDFPLTILAFNSLLCLPAFDDQCRALAAIGSHMIEGGMLILDIVNPLQLPVMGDPVPKPFFTRTNPHTGRRYTRFAAMSPFDENHCQQLHGWYDEYGTDGAVIRRPYSVTWRPIFRFEIELMLGNAGFVVERIEGGHRGEPYVIGSARMFIHARKRAGGERRSS